MNTFSVALGGQAVICCPHNRVKREQIDIAFDPTTHKAHLCACCQNLFLRVDDVPHYCQQCGDRPVYPLGGPLPDPIGEA